MSIPLSILDLAVVSAGETSADALQRTLTTARGAEAAGFTRFWVAEHHNMPAVASTSPPVLLAAIGASTSSIRVGSGGVMLPNHAPYVVAEQFAMLEALYPGRVDLGLGRAPGTDQRTAQALRRGAEGQGVDAFPRDVLELLAWSGDDRLEASLARHLSATPNATSYPDVWLLGSSGYSAQLAGMLGLRYCYAHHFGAMDEVEVMQAYRSRFQPSASLAEPYAMLCTSAIASESAERARYLAAPGKVMALGLRSGNLQPIVSPEEANARGFSEAEDQLLQRLPATKFVGETEEVIEGLRGLVQRTGVQELMLTATTHRSQDTMASMRGIAERWETAPAGALA